MLATVVIAPANALNTGALTLEAFHSDRAAGGDRDHRGPDRPACCRPSRRRGGRPPDSVRQQSQAARAGDAQLRELEWRPAAADGPDLQQRGCGGLEVELGRFVADHAVPGAGAVYNAINYTNKTTDPSNATAVSTQLKVFLCPSEPNQQAFTSTSAAGVTTTYGVSNYGWCEGTWYTLRRVLRCTDADPGCDRLQPEPPVRVVHRWAEQHASRCRGQDVYAGLSRLRHRAAARADRRRRLSRRRHRPGERRGGTDLGMQGRHGSSGMPGGGHTHWCNGNSFYDGFTTALPPNTRSPAGPRPSIAT